MRKKILFEEEIKRIKRLGGIISEDVAGATPFLSELERLIFGSPLEKEIIDGLVGKVEVAGGKIRSIKWGLMSDNEIELLLKSSVVRNAMDKIYTANKAFLESAEGKMAIQATQKNFNRLLTAYKKRPFIRPPGSTPPSEPTITPDPHSVGSDTHIPAGETLKKDPSKIFDNLRNTKEIKGYVPTETDFNDIENLLRSQNPNLNELQVKKIMGSVRKLKPGSSYEEFMKSGGNLVVSGVEKVLNRKNMGQKVWEWVLRNPKKSIVLTALLFPTQSGVFAVNLGKRAMEFIKTIVNEIQNTSATPTQTTPTQTTPPDQNDPAGLFKQ